MKYFEVDVLVTTETEDSKGNVKIKKNKESYLVDAVSVTEAEARTVQFLSNAGEQEFEVKSASESVIVEVINAE